MDFSFDFSFINEIILAIVLGVVQGIAEFLPISSTAHLRLASDFLVGRDIGITTSNIIQFGTLIAIVQYFWKDLEILFKHSLKISTSKKEFGEFWNNAKTWWKGGYQFEDTPDDVKRDILLTQIILGTIPIVIFGFLLHDFVDFLRGDLNNIALFLILGALLLAFSEFWHNRKKDQIKSKRFSKWDVLTIGFFQCFAVFPGVSRSGATLSGALLLGRDRVESIRFSFLLSVPAIGLAGIYDSLKLLKGDSGELTLLPSSQSWTESEVLLSVLGLALAFVFSYIFGYLFLKWLLKFLANNSSNIFIFYRILLGLLILLVGVLV